MEPSVSIWNYISYGIGSTANGWGAAVIGFYVNLYVLNALSLKPGHYSIIQIVAQVINAISDPLIGVASDRTKTRMGRRRPYILVGAIFKPIFFFLLFYAAPLKSQKSTLALYLCFFIGYYLAQTSFNIPHMALAMDITNRNVQRDKYLAGASVFFSLGNLLGPVLFLVTKKIYNRKDNFRLAYRMGAGVSAVFMGIFLFWVFIGVKEENNNEIIKSPLKEVFSNFLTVFRYKAYNIMMFAYICSQIAIQILQFNLESYLIIVAKMNNYMFVIMIISILSSVLFVIPLNKFIKKYEKKNVYIISNAFFTIPFVISYFYVPNGDFGIFILAIMGIFVGLGTAAGFYISSCMLNDVLMVDKLKTNKRREGAFNSVYSLLQKIMTGFVHGICSYVLEYYGQLKRDDNFIVVAEQNPVIVRTIRYFYFSSVPLAAIVLGSVALYFYPLSNEEVKRNQERIDTEDSRNTQSEE